MSSKLSLIIAVFYVSVTLTAQNTKRERVSVTIPDKAPREQVIQLDAEEWIKTFKDAGITAVILVAKHHDGFCV